MTHLRQYQMESDANRAMMITGMMTARATLASLPDPGLGFCFWFTAVKGFAFTYATLPKDLSMSEATACRMTLRVLASITWPVSSPGLITTNITTTRVLPMVALGYPGTIMTSLAWNSKLTTDRRCNLTESLWGGRNSVQFYAECLCFQIWVRCRFGCFNHFIRRQFIGDRVCKLYLHQPYKISF